MVHCLVSRQTGAIQPYFLPQDIKINAAGYIECLRHYVVPAFHAEGFTLATAAYQHDNAPAHSTRDVAAELKNQGIYLLKFPPVSPDLTPLDFYLWGRLDAWILQHHPDGLASTGALQGAIINAWRALDQGEVRRAVDDVLPRCRACIAAAGGAFEHTRQGH
eukprot:6492241-Amphidinium_carterae.1